MRLYPGSVSRRCPDISKAIDELIISQFLIGKTQLLKL